MGLCIDLGLQVVTDVANVPESGSSALTTVTVSAPSGKKAISGSIAMPSIVGGSVTGQMLLHSSYPSGDNWVFKMIGVNVTNGYDITYYVTFINKT